MFISFGLARVHDTNAIQMKCKLVIVHSTLITKYHVSSFFNCYDVLCQGSTHNEY